MTFFSWRLGTFCEASDILFFGARNEERREGENADEAIVLSHHLSGYAAARPMAGGLRWSTPWAACLGEPDAMSKQREGMRWLVHQPPEGPIRSRLICFPYACGSARVFHGWARSLPGIEVVAVEAPGKGTRLLEPPTTDLHELCEALLSEITPLARQSVPYSLFGHSYGGLLAYELCNRLQAAGEVLPRHLFLSACGAPWARSPRSYATLDDAAFKDLLVEYNATPPEVLANDAMLALLLPGLRADFAMVERYQSNWATLEGVPVHLIQGAEDDVATEEILAWQHRVARTVTLDCLPGGHFFIHDQKDGLLSIISERLRPRPIELTI